MQPANPYCARLTGAIGPKSHIMNAIEFGGPACIWIWMPGPPSAALPWLVDATDTTFDREAEAPMPVLVDLWAPWCGPCRIVAPVLEELARELAGRLKVVKVNVDENPRLAARFNARSIPMLVVIAGGEVRETLVGAQPKAALRRALAGYL